MSNPEKIKIYLFESNSAGGIICILLYVKTQFKVKKQMLMNGMRKK